MGVLLSHFDPRRVVGLSWDEFKGMVLDHYCPQSYPDQKEVEFLNLKQGNLSVTEYERKFNKLFRYALYLVDMEGKKARRFEQGLSREIAGIMAGLELLTYAEVSRRAHAISTSLMLENPVQKQPKNFWKKKMEFRE